MLDAVILPDIHLGSSNCQAQALCRMLEAVADGTIVADRLILNGDVFDSFDFRRLGTAHRKVLSLLRQLSDQIDVSWIAGNHDGAAEVSDLLGGTVNDEFTFRTGGRDVLVLHGHKFDDFLDVHPYLTWVGDCIYAVLQWVDRSHTIARLAKRSSKMFVRCATKLEEGAIAYAATKGCDFVCCGHTHLAKTINAGDVTYVNGGCWTETPCTYLTVVDGVVQIRTFEPAMPQTITTTAPEPALAR
jgi:UDP-2,3-diacylglucosamine pyrophosphatase LpxH